MRWLWGRDEPLQPAECETGCDPAAAAMVEIDARISAVYRDAMSQSALWEQRLEMLERIIHVMGADMPHEAICERVVDRLDAEHAHLVRAVLSRS